MRVVVAPVESRESVEEGEFSFPSFSGAVYEVLIGRSRREGEEAKREREKGHKGGFGSRIRAATHFSSARRGLLMINLTQLKFHLLAVEEFTISCSLVIIDSRLNPRVILGQEVRPSAK